MSRASPITVSTHYSRRVTETLPLTGERTAPGIWHENYWFARHEAAYHWITATRKPTGRVLDAGCGEGYGAELLRLAGADSVVGLDYEGTTIRRLAKVYPQINVVQGNLVQTGFADDTFELVTSLQTIEHLWEQPRFVAECRRILKPDGVLILTTPNRLTFPPGNWYHTRELTGPELAELVGAELTIVRTAGLRHGPRLTAWEQEYGDAQLATDHEHWDPALADLVRSVTAADFTIDEPARADANQTGDQADDLADSLDLLIVARKAVHHGA
jgi:SAM-dependent methyltransferase